MENKNTESEVFGDLQAWKDVERRAQDHHWFRAIVDFVWHGGMTREQALIRGLMQLADSHEILTKQFSDHLNATKALNIVVPLPPEVRKD